MVGVSVNGFPSLEEIKSANGWPSEERFNKGPVAIFECVQEIPCNPCENACPFGAINVGTPITNIPKLDFEKCTGCGNCVYACSGLAIFIVNKAYAPDKATVSFPFEYLPLPEKGDLVKAAGRDGKYICDGIVTRIFENKKSDHTTVITIEIPVEHADYVRTIKLLGREEKNIDYKNSDSDDYIADDLIVCRCEEITAGEIRKAIRETKATTITEVKRRVRSGMGLCQGKTCSKLVSRIITEETGKPAKELAQATDRPPVRPVTFGELAGGEK